MSPPRKGQLLTHASADGVEDRTLATGRRDGLLWDLLAVSMLVEGARAHLDDDRPTIRGLLDDASTTVRTDIGTV